MLFFSCVTPGAFDELTSMDSLNLISNPFNCNCHMTWFADWLRQKGKLYLAKIIKEEEKSSL